MAGLRRRALLCALLPGCILDNPKFDLDSTTLDTASGSTSRGVSSSTVGDTLITGGTESASGTTSMGVSTTVGAVTTTPTMTTTTTTGVSTTTVGAGTDGTSTTGLTSTTGDKTTDASTGSMVCDVNDLIEVFQDGDLDGYGVESMKVCPDQVPEGYVELGGDCDDGDPQVNPGVAETCDGADNNCNGLKDEHSESNPQCELVEALLDANKVCLLAAYGGHFYYTCKASRVPSMADEICSVFAVDDGAKSYHVKIESSPENEAVKGFAAGLGADVSIGLRDTKGQNLVADHKWVEGDAALTYGNIFSEDPWGDGQPDKAFEAWTQMTYQDGLWGDIGVLEARPFICEAEPKP